MHNRIEIVVERSFSLEELPGLAEKVERALAGADAGVRLAVATEQVGLPLLQLLCSVHRSAQAKGRAFEVAWQRPEPVTALLQAAGFTRHVSCPRSPSGECLWLLQHWS